MRMKKEWVRPTITGEQFVANEYVSACWYGKCNITGNVYVDDGDGKFDASKDKWSYYNTACGHQFSIQGANNNINDASQLINAFVVGKHWNWDTHEWETTTIPVYNFDKVHVSTIGSIQKATDRPNHS